VGAIAALEEGHVLSAKAAGLPLKKGELGEGSPSSQTSNTRRKRDERQTDIDMPSDLSSLAHAISQYQYMISETVRGIQACPGNGPTRGGPYSFSPINAIYLSMQRASDLGAKFRVIRLNPRSVHLNY